MFKSIVSVVLFAASALGAVQFTSAPSTVEAGKSYTFTYTATGSGPVSILLKNGPSGNLQTVATITSAATGGSYTWTAPSTYPPGTYAFEIDQGTDVNYWGPITYTGGVAASSAAVSSAPVSSASASSKPASVSSAPASISSGYSNSTTTASSLSTATRTGSTTSAASPTTSRVVSSNDAVTFGSPVALVLSVVAAMLYLQ